MGTSRDIAVREQRLERIRQDALHLASEPERTAVPIPKATPDHGYYGLPLLKSPQWKWQVPVYFFTGGAAGAAALLAAAARLNERDARIVRDAQWIAAIGGALSPALMTADLGMPSRFLNMFRVFKVQSPMSVGSWTLLVFSGSAAATAMLGEFERRTGCKIPVFMEAAPALSLLSGLVVATYTGVLVGATAIPAWNEYVDLLPIHFAASGLAAAAGMLELRGHETPALNALGIGAAAVETVSGAVIETRKRPGTEPLRSGVSGWTMRIAGFLSGPLPLFLRLFALGKSPQRSRKLKKAAALSAVAGSLVTRWAWFEAGRVSARDPRSILAVDRKPQPSSASLPQRTPAKLKAHSATTS